MCVKVNSCFESAFSIENGQTSDRKFFECTDSKQIQKLDCESRREPLTSQLFWRSILHIPYADSNRVAWNLYAIYTPNVKLIFFSRILSFCRCHTRPTHPALQLVHIHWHQVDRRAFHLFTMKQTTTQTPMPINHHHRRITNRRNIKAIWIISSSTTTTTINNNSISTIV